MAKTIEAERKKAKRLESVVRCSRPKTRAQLRKYVKSFLRMSIPDKKICEGHCAPMDYLWHAFSCDNSTLNIQNSKLASGDAIVWANRGGGKTQLAALATLLDCIFKPDCQVRILGGSLEQSRRMYEYLLNFVEGDFRQSLNGPPLAGKCRFANKSRVEVLTQSSRNVRGRHVQKLRCDEVELFDENVFTAAQFVPHSKNGILASMEIISTMHRPYGLMQKVVEEAQSNHTPIFKWCLWETIQKCVGRTCSQCPLFCDCDGRAKNAEGFLSIDDAIAQMQRSSRAAWESEMLCLRPSLENAVFADFNPAIHVRQLDYDPNLPLYRSIDFGFINPFVCLWIQVDKEGTVRVIDEYIRSRATIDLHAATILSWNSKLTTQNSKLVAVAATYCDPAGVGVNDVNGSSAVRELRKFGINCRYRRSSILEGIELIRRALKDGTGKSTLLISPRCKNLIEALRCYHYTDNFADSSAVASAKAELPYKDGLYDHPIDALRYFFVNYTAKSCKVFIRRY